MTRPSTGRNSVNKSLTKVGLPLLMLNHTVTGNVCIDNYLLHDCKYMGFTLKPMFGSNQVGIGNHHHFRLVSSLLANIPASYNINGKSLSNLTKNGTIFPCKYKPINSR